MDCHTGVPEVVIVAQTKAVHEGVTTALPEVVTVAQTTAVPEVYSAALMQATEGCDHICARVAIQKTCRCVNTMAERKIMLYTTCK